MLVIAAGHSCHSKVGFLVGFLLGKLVCLDHSGAIKANNNQGGSFQVSSSLGVLGLMSEADDVFSNRNLLSSSWRQQRAIFSHSIQQERNRACYWNPFQLPRASEFVNAG